MEYKLLDDTHNQAGIAHGGGIPLLLKLLDSRNGSLQHNAAFALYGLADNELKLFREPSQRESALLLGQFAAADTDCKVHIVQRGAVGPLIEMLQSPDAQLREMSAFALGRLAQDTHNQAGIAHGGGIPLLLKLLDSRNGSLQHNAAFALYGLADNEENSSRYSSMWRRSFPFIHVDEGGI
ncbi:hypothetical protein L1987_86016 [Smallanthus sonchifolius]|uniref:Uncharacterized protein n=1 Tax=Smallanthus sonchifolius TaxID=185202 RepID=A0ACB8XYK7_9ASTR|nr:hypothetical protein L1987_86016 [Smallanthus sonchifolius]